MLSWEQVEQLHRFDGAGAGVLSLYLDLDPARQVARSYRIVFKDLVNDASAALTDSARHDLDREAARVVEWFDGLDKPQGLGLILFSSTPRELWLADFVSVPVRDHLAFDVRPARRESSPCSLERSRRSMPSRVSCPARPIWED
jgi:hypothetical protein